MELVSEDVEAQTHQVLKNIKAIAEDNEVSMNSAIKSTVYLVDIEDYSKVNVIYSDYFEKPYPARTVVAVKDLPKGAKVEMEMLFIKEWPELGR